MKLNEQHFKELLKQEVKKFALKEGWIKEESKELTLEDFDTITPKATEVTKEDLQETQVAIKLAEEFKRMKTLLDFRNPLLGEKK